MKAKATLTINGKAVKANIGETLVEAALGGWMVLPHECCAGQCQSCRVRIASGAVDDHGTAEGGTVLGCIATVAGDAEITFDNVPHAVKRTGIVTELVQLTPDVWEVVIKVGKPMPWLAGQYISTAFAGLPARQYSPSPRLDGTVRSNEIVLHIERMEGGLVSSELGRRIQAGVTVKLRGPYGHAFHRKGPEPLVLVSGGTGFAPIFAIARKVLDDEPGREVTLVAGASRAESLYMREAIDWLRAQGLKSAHATASRSTAEGVLTGRPTDHMPELHSSHIVYVAGSPRLVDAVKQRASTARAQCYADPFLPSTRQGYRRPDALGLRGADQNLTMSTSGTPG